MTIDLEARLRDSLAGTVLAERVALVRDPLVVRRGGDAAVRDLDGSRLLGLARAVTTNPEAARFLAHRPALLERIAAAGPGALTARGDALAAEAAATPADLEGGLDALRLLRRDETLFAAVLELGGVEPFETLSVFLSRLAEAILGEALSRAQRSLGVELPEGSLAVLGMGKIGGREFTHHSDLDLIFLCRSAERMMLAARVAQRLIAYLTTRTGAGVAYAVDSRLRPSGNQGLLVTTLDSFAAYQQRDAQTWEHLALMRARVVAGDVAEAGPVLAGVRDAILTPRRGAWREVADMRHKVERERAHADGGRIAFKTGAGGLMDVDFLAAAGTLERGADVALPALPGNAALLRAVAPGPGTEAVLSAYAVLRRVEARARWVLGRAAESIDPGAESFPQIVALSPFATDATGLVSAIANARARIRRAFDAVGRHREIGRLSSLV